MKRISLPGAWVLVAVLALAACSGVPRAALGDGRHEGPPFLAGHDADARIARWHGLLATLRTAPETLKLERVNVFFNDFDYIDDSTQWRTADYWATPIETLRRNGGDCEDLVIAKYFSLRELQVPEERLHLTYVIAGFAARAHMVLAYYPAPGAEPLILDSLTSEIRPASQRPELIPIFGFNHVHLWMAGAKRPADYDPALRFSRWREVLQRISQEPQLTVAQL